MKNTQNNPHSKNPTFISFKRNEEAQERKVMIGVLYFFKMELCFLLTLLPFRAKYYKINTSTTCHKGKISKRSWLVSEHYFLLTS